MDPKLLEVIADGGTAAAVIVVVVFFLRHIERSGKQFSETIDAISKRSDVRSERLVGAMDTLTDKVNGACERIDKR